MQDNMNKVDIDSINPEAMKQTLLFAIPVIAICLVLLWNFDWLTKTDVEPDPMYQGVRYKQSELVKKQSSPKVALVTQPVNRSAISDEFKLKTLADTIWCENRKSEKSMELVMSVIHTRANTKNLNGFYEKAIKPYQFSCLNDKETILAQVRSKQDDVRYNEAKAIVHRYVYEQAKPIIQADFYYAPKKVKKPSYLKDKALVLRYEGHDFYSSNPDAKVKLAKL